VFGIPSPNEFLLVVIVVLLLTLMGWWPQVIRGLRELRGDIPPEAAPPDMSNAEVCFKMLGVSPSARWDDIEKAYRAKAKIHHPDRGGDEDTMRALNDAYAHLKKLRSTPRA
jgi:hypothetical protein